MKKIDSKINVIEKNLEKIRNVFPEVIVEGKVDFNLLKLLLNDEIEESKERYSFTWNGLSRSIKLAQTPTTFTLRPKKKSSKNWDTTNNIYIEGDNLEVLKLLQKTYYGRIKMIYIDPPYNTGRDFIYKDDFKETKKSFVDNEGIGLSSNPNTDGKYHTNWLNMMLPRLILSKNLLKDDGVIFISIDDNELFNLKKSMDIAYGEDNFIACLPTILNLKGNNDQFGFSGTHEYTLVYAKNKSALDDLNGLPLTNDEINEYSLEDEFGKYKKGATLMRTGQDGFRSKRPKGYYPIYVKSDLSELSIFKMNEDDYVVYPKTKDGVEMSWRRSPENLEQSKSEFIISKNKDGIAFYKKQRLSDDLEKGKKPKSLFYKPEYSSGNGTAEVVKLFGNRVFDNPKPLALIEDLIKIGTNNNENDIILDFFSGSATTAHATMSLNKKFSGNRQFILVQLPEKTNDNSSTVDLKYKNICQIGEKRIDLAGEQIKDEWQKEHPQDTLLSSNEKFTVDIGFKVFELDSTNIKPWDNENELDENSIFDYGDVFKEDRNKEDVLYEILLKYGVFDIPTSEVIINGKIMYCVGKRSMIVCLEDEISIEDIKEIAEFRPKSVVFKEAGFKNDNDKINAEYSLEKAGVEDIKCI